jgi:adenosylhomocysteine nucleosidase
MSDPVKIIICFAVKEEAAPFRPLVMNRPDIQILVTGMGAKNASQSFLAAMEKTTPSFVITAGYAGGLNPGLPPESIVIDATVDFPLTDKLLQAGAQKGTFLCATTVAITKQEKATLFDRTQCDAVEMESGVIRQHCAEQGIPAATVRVISDAAQEDLPLNFNELMTPEMNMNFGKLAWTLMKSPGKIPELMRFQKRVQSSARKLAQVLSSSL